MKLLVDGDFSTWSRGFDYDDCLALLMARDYVKAVTCVGGNVPVSDAVRNAIKCFDGLVFEGVEPQYNAYFNLLKSLRTRFDSRDFPLLKKVHNGNASKAFKSLSFDKAVFLGPVSNYVPELRAGEIILMSGSLGWGNITPFAEFNAYLDPVKLNELLRREVTVVPLNVTRKAVIGKHLLSKFKGDLAHLARLNRLTLHDPLTMAYALRPELFRTKKTGLKVLSFPRGLTREIKGDNVTLVTGFDRDGFIKFFKESMHKTL